MKILVTGASGNVGSMLVKELLNYDEVIRVGGSDKEKLKNMFGNKVEIVEFDFTKKETFAAALKDVNRVFLMRPPHLGKPEDLYPFIEAMKDSKIELVAFLSLMGAQHNPIPPHHKIEKYIEKLEIPYAHIRPGFFMQNLSGIHAKEIREKNKIFVPAGKSKTSFIDAADIGLAIAVILHDAKKFQNTAHTITGPAALDYYQVAQILTEVTGKEIIYVKPGFLKYRSYYLNVRKLEKNYVNVTVALYFMTRMGTAKAVTDGFSKLTGIKPRSLREFAIDNRSAFID